MEKIFLAGAICKKFIKFIKNKRNFKINWKAIRKVYVKLKIVF